MSKGSHKPLFLIAVLLACLDAFAIFRGGLASQLASMQIHSILGLIMCFSFLNYHHSSTAARPPHDLGGLDHELTSVQLEIPSLIE